MLEHVFEGIQSLESVKNTSETIKTASALLGVCNTNDAGMHFDCDAHFTLLLQAAQQLDSFQEKPPPGTVNKRFMNHILPLKMMIVMMIFMMH